MSTQSGTKFSEIQVQNHNRHGSGGRAEQQVNQLARTEGETRRPPAAKLEGGPST